MCKASPFGTALIVFFCSSDGHWFVTDSYLVKSYSPNEPSDWFLHHSGAKIIENHKPCFTAGSARDVLPHVQLMYSDIVIALQVWQNGSLEKSKQWRPSIPSRTGKISGPSSVWTPTASIFLHFVAIKLGKQRLALFASPVFDMDLGSVASSIDRLQDLKWKHPCLRLKHSWQIAFRLCLLVSCCYCFSKLVNINQGRSQQIRVNHVVSLQCWKRPLPPAVGSSRNQLIQLGQFIVIDSETWVFLITLDLAFHTCSRRCHWNQLLCSAWL